MKKMNFQNAKPLSRNEMQKIKGGDMPPGTTGRPCLINSDCGTVYYNCGGNNPYQFYVWNM